MEGDCVSEACGSFSCPAGLACLSGCCEDVQCSGVICSSGGCQFGRCTGGAAGGGGGSMCGLTGGGGGSTGGGGGSDDAGMDAGTDAGLDGGRDAGTDAGTDGGTDAGIDAGVDAGTPPPVIIFSAQFDDVAIASSPNSLPIYGRITGLTATNASSCEEIVTVLADGGLQSPDAGLCGTSRGAWVPLPDGSWTYDPGGQVWRRVIAPPSVPNRYRYFARNLTTDAGSAPVLLEITGPTIIFSTTVDGPARTDFVMSAPFYGRITGLGAANGVSCWEPSFANNCLNQANFASLTANGWTFDASRSVWRQTFPINWQASGEYLHYARNTQDQSTAIPVRLTITP